MPIETKQSFTVSSDVMFQEVAGETVLLDLESEAYFGLDEVGTRVWALLNEGKSAGEIVDSLLGEYEVERSELEKDVNTLLEQLLIAGLVTR